MSKKNKNSQQQSFENIINLVYNDKSRKKDVFIKPRNIIQESYLEALNNKEIDICVAAGPAGTGKTLLATLSAIKEFKNKNIKKIVVTRPNIAVDDKDIGFLPGDIMDKMAPWVRPIFDIFEDFFTYKQITTMLKYNMLEICPLAFVRGRTFKNSWIILDEAQGTTPNSMLSVLTRIGSGSKMVVTGDIDQSDYVQKNGLQDFLERYNNNLKRIKIIKFTAKEVERHPVVKNVLEIYKQDTFTPPAFYGTASV